MLRFRRCVALVVALSVPAGLIASESADAVTSGISGPVTGGLFNEPQSKWAGLEAFGYVETEYFVDGVATAYAPTGEWQPDGIWPAAETTTAEFRTRVLVRRPTDPAKFNGTVLVEWNNVTAGFDTSPTWTASLDEILRGGYAFIGVSAQRVGVNQMINGDPGRYSSLVHPGDAYSYDIFTQIAQHVRGGARRVLLPGMTPDKIIAMGESQSASRLVTYINAVHPLERIYNGFLVFSRGSGAASIADGVVMPTRPVMRTDTPGRIINVQTEGDIAVLRSHYVRQDDMGRFRLWEIAGGSHTDEHTLSPKNPPTPSVAGSPCEFRLNSARSHMVVAAAVRGLHEWTRKIASPHKAPRIDLGPDIDADDPVARDADGNALGGIRLPQMEVPIATIDGLVNPAAPGAPPLFQSFCRLFGRTQPFSEAELDARYPSRVGYVIAFHDAAVAVGERRWVLPEDVQILVWEALVSGIGADA